MMKFLETRVENLFLNLGLSAEVSASLRLFVFILLMLLIAVAAFYITKKLIVHYLYEFLKRTPLKWDDVIAEKKVFNNVAHIVPAFIIKLMAAGVFYNFETVLPVINRITDAYLIIVGSTIIVAFLKLFEFLLSSHETLRDKPISSYFQLIKIILYIVVAILALSVLLNKTPVYFLSAFGAMTAILLLVFKDTILGLVASVQMSSNDMIKVGDWIEMQKFGADGAVVAINLNTVKVQNFDKTITTIPTYHFITDSFKNWRGMQLSGGRRIKRSIFISADSIMFVSPEMRETFKKYHLIEDYVSGRQQEIEKYNKENNVNTEMLINGRRMTNIGVFRRYIEFYLKKHPGINKEMHIMVRQMAMESKGVPLEIYCFTNTVVWVDYESIQSDIFDHLLSAAKYFNLDIYQEPGSKDFAKAFA
ncbi:mechanosensitive ion channel family protein [Polluticaenibacter yanchengensis]|uniref:Mechanosensitive ion channel n=1 Tax=Polluticaenibacter yanchengensis TaxID=3014562 RepID=A0ABT4UJ03_9BACT|nr:mechanosensitive ion channel [Chitinophagaceae bacterium LY-5]